MIKKKAPKKIAISIDLRSDFVICGELTYSVNTGRFVEENPQYRITDSPSFTIKSDHTASTSKKILHNSLIVATIGYINNISNISQIGFLDKSTEIIEIYIALSLNSWTHVFNSLLHTKCEQIVLYADEVYRRKCDITVMYLNMIYDESVLY